MICQPCCDGRHESCPGGTRCGCQHRTDRRPAPAEPVEGADELVRAIRAALDETERIALAADGSRWYLDLDEGGVVEHFERNDPAAVLRRVAADREIVARYEQACREQGHWCEDGQQEVAEDIVRIVARGLGINPEEETAQ